MTAAESFITELARASGRGNRALRQVPRESREDVLSAALLWCWENKEGFNPTQETLDSWFAGAVRRESRRMNRGRARHVSVDELEVELATRDQTAAAAAASITADQISRHPGALQYWDELSRLANGETWQAVTDGMSVLERSTFAGALIFLVETIPEELDRQPSGRAPSRAMDDNHSVMSAADHKIQSALFPPTHGVDCPPCNRCKWYSGFTTLPSRGHEVVDPEVKVALSEIGRRKLEIAEHCTDEWLDRGFLPR